jgi:hypothetical protein
MRLILLLLVRVVIQYIKGYRRYDFLKVYTRQYTIKAYSVYFSGSNVLLP